MLTLKGLTKPPLSREALPTGLCFVCFDGAGEPTVGQRYRFKFDALGGPERLESTKCKSLSSRE